MAHRRAAAQLEGYGRSRSASTPQYRGSLWSLSGWVNRTGEAESVTTSKLFYKDGGNKVVIKLRDSFKSNEIIGTVQLSKDMTHTGLLIDLQGYFQPCNETEPMVNLFPMRRPSQSAPSNSAIFHRFCGGAPGAIISSPSFRKYLFHLELPEDSLPPSFSSPQIGKIKYQLRVWMQSNSRYILLGKKTIEYFGQYTVFPTAMEVIGAGEVEQEISGDGLNAVLQLPRKEYLRNENITFTLKITDPSKLAVKKVEVVLCRKISCIKKHYPNPGELRMDEIVGESRAVDSVTFKRFLRREVISRSGKFSWGAIDLPTFIGNDFPKLKIKYFIQMNITTQTSVLSTEVDIILGTNRASPSGPIELGSMLSLFPPDYSALSSRATSSLSLETLPPHYDDL